MMTENTQKNETLSVAEILHRRAEILAQPVEEPTAEETFLDAVLFQLAGETYAIALEFLQDVLPLSGLAPIPCTPPFVAGIINVRGQIVSVVSLKTLFDLPAAPETQYQKVLLLSNGEMIFGVIVDRMFGTKPLALSGLQSPPMTLSGFRADYVRGITPDTVILLDAAKMLGDARLIVHETA